MRIAMFSDVYSQATGVTTSLRLLADELVKKGCDVTVFTGSGSSKTHKVVNLPAVRFPLAETYEVILKPPFRVAADVVHVHTPYCAGWLGMMQKHAPRVVTTHTLPQNVFPGKLHFLQPLAWSYLVSFYNAADRVVCQTKRTQALFEKHGLSKPVSVVSGGIDLHELRKAHASRFNKKYEIKGDFVLSTARLSEEKRPQLALQACRELDLPIVLTSDGPLREALEKNYPEARFLGFVPREDLRDAYAAARVFTLCSAPETEGEGLAVVEAMAARTPVIASDAHHAVDGVNAFSFNSPAELKRKLSRLWSDKKLRLQFAKQGLKEAQECDVKKYAEKMLRVYDAVQR